MHRLLGELVLYHTMCPTRYLSQCFVNLGGVIPMTIVREDVDFERWFQHRAGANHLRYIVRFFEWNAHRSPEGRLPVLKFMRNHQDRWEQGDNSFSEFCYSPHSSVNPTSREKPSP